MTAYLQRSREEGTRPECRCERGIAHEARSATLCPISPGISLSESSLTSRPLLCHSLLQASSAPSPPRLRRQLKHPDNSRIPISRDDEPPGGSSNLSSGVIDRKKNRKMYVRICISIIYVYAHMCVIFYIKSLTNYHIVM